MTVRYACTRYTYLRSTPTIGKNGQVHKSGDPHTCVAIKIDPDAKTISFAMSTCNPQDEFSKKRARFIACRRLSTHAIDIENVDFTILSGHDVTRMVMQSISNMTTRLENTEFHDQVLGSYVMPVMVKGAPKRSVNAAKAWLMSAKKAEKAQDVWLSGN